MRTIKGAQMPTCADNTLIHARTGMHTLTYSLANSFRKGVKGGEETESRRGESSKGRGREIWPVFRGPTAADRGGIGYHSLTPNTFTADIMINEPGAVLQGLFLDPLDPLSPSAQLPLTPHPPPHQRWTPSIWTKATRG